MIFFCFYGVVSCFHIEIVRDTEHCVGLLAPDRVASMKYQMARTVQRQSFNASVSAIMCVTRREGARVFVENYVTVEPEGI